MFGPPGCGKTMLAKAVAHHTTAAFIRVVGSEFVQKYLGEGPRMVRDVFRYICCIFQFIKIHILFYQSVISNSDWQRKMPQLLYSLMKLMRLLQKDLMRRLEVM